MNAVLNDESPRVQSPWNKYVNTSLYAAVTRAIAATKAAGLPLRPANAPIGYLPGDDVTPSKRDMQMLTANAACQAPHIDRLTPDRGLIGRDISMRIEGTGLKGDNELSNTEVIIAGEGPGQKLEITQLNVQPLLITLTLRVAEDAPPGNHSVKVNVDGVDSNSLNFFVQIPKSVQRADFYDGLTPSQQSKGIGPIVLLTDGSVLALDGSVVSNLTHRCGAYRNLLYQLMDQDQTPHPIMAVVTVAETFPDNEKTGDNIPALTGAGHTNSAGFFEDDNGITGPTGGCATAPAVSGSQKQHLSVTIGSTKYDLTTVIRITMSYDPNGNPQYTITNEIITP